MGYLNLTSNQHVYGCYKGSLGACGSFIWSIIFHYFLERRGNNVP